MANTWATAAIVVMTASRLMAAEKQVDGDRPLVFVHIENRAAVPPETISGARRELEHLYDAAGVRIESSAASDHRRCVQQLTIHVVLLAGPAANRFIKLEHVTPNILAQANSDARRVYVFWERVGPAVNRQAVAHGDALGVVIAHELGHVLMPARSHSQTGIMQDNYNVYLSYGLQFTVEEAAVMRAFIEAHGHVRNGR